MKTKLFTSISLVLVLMIALAWTAGAVSAEPACDPDYVTQAGNVISVLPSGVDDTTNLQCAFDMAVDYGAGAHVLLESGTFNTEQIVVDNFQGTFTGVGTEDTNVLNLQNIYVTPVDFYFDLPSATNPWPGLFSFVDGEFEISDLSIHIVGESPTTGWTIQGVDPPLKELACAIVVIGTEAYVKVDNVFVAGEMLENSYFGYNLINGIFFEGLGGAVPPPPLAGSFQVRDSVFQRMASGTPIMNLSNASVTISENSYAGVLFGMDGGDFVNSSLEFSHNNVEAVFGIDFYNSYLPEDDGSTFLIKNNHFQGVMGPTFEQTFGAGNQCLIIGNNVQQVTDFGVYLGPGTAGCTVVGSGGNTNVLDLGTDNILTGVNNMGVGIEPDIRQLLWKKP
jgi:hypothetical protein